jgi:hypothetical protein
LFSTAPVAHWRRAALTDRASELPTDAVVPKMRAIWPPRGVETLEWNQAAKIGGDSIRLPGVRQIHSRATNQTGDSRLNGLE